jgi:hypothetical protein
MDGEDEAAAPPSEMFILLTCPCCCGVVFDAIMVQGEFVQQL